LPEHEIHSEVIPHDEHHHTEQHINEAMREHEVAKIRDQLELKAQNNSEQISPPSNNQNDFSLDMIFRVYYRKRYMTRGEDDLTNHASSLETEFFAQEVHY